MKKIKFIVPALAIVIIIGVLAAVFIGKSGDGNSSNSGYKQPQTVTLKEYLDGGPRIMFWKQNIEDGIDKDQPIIWIFLFEDGKVYQTQTSFSGLTWGEASKMTDEELIEYVKNSKSEYHGSAIDNAHEYSLHIYTDASGNNLAKEGIEDVVELTPYTYSATIYDSVFTGFITSNGHNFLGFRNNDGITVTLDNIGDEGVEVD